MTDKTPKELRGVISAAMGLIDGAANILYAAGEELTPANADAWKRRFADVALALDAKGAEIIERGGLSFDRHPVDHVHKELSEKAPELLANPPQFH